MEYPVVQELLENHSFLLTTDAVKSLSVLIQTVSDYCDDSGGNTKQLMTERTNRSPYKTQVKRLRKRLLPLSLQVDRTLRTTRLRQQQTGLKGRTMTTTGRIDMKDDNTNVLRWPLGLAMAATGISRGKPTGETIF